ncbi:MAG TPA: T9SS type A sorting domain-containing protein [Puia sp.]|nr:T9SS type A sorting domain-containing protein [Puia sp.]
MKKLYTFLTIGYSFTLRNLALVFFTSLFAHSAAAQSCPANASISISSYPNTYFPASQSNVPAGSTSIVLGAPTYGTTPISSGDILLIIQMQGAQIKSTNNSNYGANNGTGSGYLNNGQLLAGNMEYVVASNSVSIAGGTLNLASGLVNSYKNTPFGTDGQYTYQVIRVPVYYDVKLTSTITAPRWDGFTGGVIVLFATDKILMNSQTIDASGLGFRGGGGRAFNGAGSGSSSDYITSASSNANGGKGEGIAGTPKYLNHNNSFLDVSGTEGYPNGSYGQGAPANAGGGGTDGNPASNNDENTGGGGGANGGAGGIGGNAWRSNIASGGRPGAAFAQVSASRLIMGGGGGAGTTNNGTGSPNPGTGFASSGAAGGGLIILIGTNGITGTGTIKANGVAANSTVTNDGAGGGGAGGAVLIYSGNGITSNLTVQAKGGTGGSNQVSVPAPADAHGPGGGGGGGIIYSNSTLNAASTVAGGGAGTTSLQTTNYGATSGASGVIVNTMSQSDPAQVPLHCIPLPVNFLDLTAIKENSNVLLTWEVAHEINTQYYIVERSIDGINFSSIGSTSFKEGPATGNIYQFTDVNVTGTGGSLYYRIRELDTDGQFIYSKVVSVRLNNLSGKFSVYPNPSQSSVTVSFSCVSSGPVSLRLFDMKGSLLWQQQYSASAGQNNVQIDCIRNIPPGTYILQWFDGLKPEQVKIMVTH